MSVTALYNVYYQPCYMQEGTQSQFFSGVKLVGIHSFLSLEIVTVRSKKKKKLSLPC